VVYVAEGLGLVVFLLLLLLLVPLVLSQVDLGVIKIMVVEVWL
jgi:hypothetical protein